MKEKREEVGRTRQGDENDPGKTRLDECGRARSKMKRGAERMGS